MHHDARHDAHHVRVVLAAGRAVAPGRGRGAARHEARHLERVDGEVAAIYGTEPTRERQTTLLWRHWDELWVVGLDRAPMVAHRHVQRILERDAPLDGENIEEEHEADQTSIAAET